MTILGIGKIDLTDLADAIISGSQPSSTEEGQLWIDNSDPKNPPVLKVYTNGKWVTQSLDVKKMDEGLAKEINKLTETLGSMVNDNKLDINERITLVREISRIIGAVPSTSAEVLTPYRNKLPTGEELDATKKGEYARLRIAATKLGIDSTSAEMVAYTKAYNSLVETLKKFGDNSDNVYPWDITDLNKARNVNVDADEFRQKWVEYYNAQGQIQTAILSVPGPAGVSPANISLSNEVIGIPTDDKGNNAIYDQAFTHVKIYIGGTDTTNEWTIRHRKLTGNIVYSMTEDNNLGPKFTITQLDSDLASIEIIASKEGYSDLKKIINISKVKTGEKAILEYLDVSSTVVVKDVAGNLLPGELEVKGLRKEGNLQPETDSYIYEVYTSTSNETAFVKVYTSPDEGEEKYVFNLSTHKDNLRLLKFTMLNKKTKTLIDSQTVVIVSDGANGTSPLFVDLSNDSVVINTDGLGNALAGSYVNATTDIRVFLGTTEITNNSEVSIEYTPSNGIEFTNTRNKLTVTNMSSNNGKVSVIVTYKGNRITKEFTLSKNKNGIEGHDAINRRISGPSVINLTDNINSYTYSLLQRIGNKPETALENVEFKIYNGKTLWKTETQTTLTLTKEDIRTLNGTTPINEGLIIEARLGGDLMDKEVITVVKDGADGKSISSVVTEYITTSTPVKPLGTESGWNVNAPTIEQKLGKFTWMRTKTTYNTGEIENSDPVVISDPNQVLKVVYANINEDIVATYDKREIELDTIDVEYFTKVSGKNIIPGRVYTAIHEIKIPTLNSKLKDFGRIESAASISETGNSILYYEKIGEEGDDTIYRIWHSGKAKDDKVRVDNFIGFYIADGARFFELNNPSKLVEGYLFKNTSPNPAGREYRGEALVTQGADEPDLNKYTWYRIVGREGQSAVSYSLELSNDSVRKTVTGIYEPGIIEVKLRRIVGDKSSYLEKRHIRINIVDKSGDKSLYTPSNTAEKERAIIDLNNAGKDIDRIEIAGLRINGSEETVVHSRTITVIKDPALQGLDPFLNIFATEGEIYSQADDNTINPSENTIKAETRNLNQIKYSWSINGKKVKSSSDIPPYEKVTKNDYVSGDVKADTGEIIPNGDNKSNTWVSSTYLQKRADSPNFIVIGGMPSNVTCKVYQYDSKGKYLGTSKILDVPAITVKALMSETKQLAVVFKTTEKIDVSTLEGYNIRIIYSDVGTDATRPLNSSRDNLPFDVLKVMSSDMRDNNSVKVTLEVEGLNNGRTITLSDSIVLNKVTRENVKTYTWRVYAEDDDGTTGFSLIPTNRSKYIGFAFNKPTDTPSMNKTDYIWMPNTALINDLDEKIESSKDLENKGSQNMISMYDIINFKLNNDDFNRRTFARKNLEGNPFSGNEYPMYIDATTYGEYVPLNGKQPLVSLEKDKYYTFSMWVYVKRPSGNDYLENTDFVRASGWGESIGEAGEFITLKETDKNKDFKFINETDTKYSIRSNKWVRIAFTFKAKNDNSTFSFGLNFKTSEVGFTKDYYIAGIQLEEGKNLSSYSKSVKDIIHGNSLRNYVVRSSDLTLRSSKDTSINGDYLSSDFLNDRDEIYSFGYDVELIDFKGKLNGFAVGLGPSDSNVVYSPVTNMDKNFKDIDYTNIPNPINTKFRVYGSFSQRDFSKYVLKVISNHDRIVNGEIVISNLTINKGPVLGQYTYANEDQSSFFNDSLLDNLVVTDNFLNIDRFRLSNPMLVEPVNDPILFGEYNAIKVKSDINRNMLLDTDVPSLSKKVALQDRYFSDSSYSGIIGNPIFKSITANDKPVSNVNFLVEASNNNGDNSENVNGREVCWYDKSDGVGMEAGKTYTASFYARKVSNTDVAVIKTQYGKEGAGYTSWYDEVTSSEWTKISRTFTMQYNSEPEKVRLWLGGIGCKYTGTVQTTGFKLEEGSKDTPYLEGSRSFTIEVDDLNPNTEYYLSLEARSVTSPELTVNFPVKIRTKHSKDVSFYDAFVDNSNDFTLTSTINNTSSTLIGKKFNTGTNGKSITITFPNISQSDYYIYKVQVKKSGHYIPYTPSSKDLTQASYTTTLSQETFIFSANSQGRITSGPTFPNNSCDFNLYVNGKKTRNFNMVILKVSNEDTVREGFVYDLDNDTKTIRINSFPKNQDYGWIKVGIVYAGTLVDVKKITINKTVPGADYTWTAYADDVDKVTLNVKGFSFSNDNKAWIGIARHMVSPTPTDDYNIYEWYTVSEEKALAESSIEDRDSGEGKDFVFTTRGQEGGLAQLSELEGLGHEFVTDIDEVTENYIYETTLKKQGLADINFRDSSGEFGRWFVYEKVGNPVIEHSSDRGLIFNTDGNSYLKLRCPIYRLPTSGNDISMYLRVNGFGRDFTNPFDYDKFTKASFNLVINGNSRDRKYDIEDNGLRLEYSMNDANYDDLGSFNKALQTNLKVYMLNSRVTFGYTVNTYYRSNFDNGTVHDDKYIRKTIPGSNTENLNIVDSEFSSSGKPLETVVAVEYQGRKAFAFAGKYAPKHNNSFNERFATKLPFLGKDYSNMEVKVPSTAGKMYLELAIYPNSQFNITDIAMSEAPFTGDLRALNAYNPPSPSIGYPKSMVGVKDFTIYTHRYQESILKESGDSPQKFYFNKYLDFNTPDDTYSLMVSYKGMLNNLYSINTGYFESVYNEDFKAGRFIPTRKGLNTDLKDPWHNPKYNLQFGGDFAEMDEGFFRGWAYSNVTNVTYESTGNGFARFNMGTSSNIKLITRGKSITAVPDQEYTISVSYKRIAGEVSASGVLYFNNDNRITLNFNDRTKDKFIGRIKTTKDFNGEVGNIDITLSSTDGGVFELGKVMVLKGNIADKDIPDFIGSQGEETGIERILWKKNVFTLSELNTFDNGKYFRYLASTPSSYNKLLQYVSNSVRDHNHRTGDINSYEWYVHENLSVKLIKNMRNADESYIPLEDYNNKKNFRSKNVSLAKPLYKIGEYADTLILNEDDGKYYVTEKIGVLRPNLSKDNFSLVNGLWEVKVNINDLKWDAPDIDHNIVTSNLFNTERKSGRTYLKSDKGSKSIIFVIPSLDVLYDPRLNDKKIIKDEHPYDLFKYLEGSGNPFTIYYVKDNPSSYDLANNRSASIALSSLSTFEGNNYFYTSIFYPTKMKVKFRSKNKAAGSNISNQLSELTEKADAFEKSIMESLLDNVVSEREKSNIENNRQLLENENARLIAQYTAIPSDVKNKSALDNAKNVYVSRYNELINKIDTVISIINSGRSQPENIQKYQDELTAGFNSYRLDLRNFVLEMQKALFNKVDDIVAEIESKNYVKSSEFEKLDTAFNFRINKAGGMNMLKNSTGYIWSTNANDASTNMWSITGSTQLSDISSDMSPVYNSLGTGCGFKITAPKDRDVTMYQSLATSPGRYSLDLFFKNDHSSGGNEPSFIVKVINGDITKLNDDSRRVFLLESNSRTTAPSSTDIDNYRYTKYLNGFEYVNPEGAERKNPFAITESFSSSNPYNLTVAITVKRGNTVALSGIMLKGGETSSWTPHPSENYSGNVTMDSTGLTVRSNSNQNYTVMNTNEFAGYYVGGDGKPEKIFTLSGEETQVKNLYVKGNYLRLGNLRLETVDDDNGWIIYKV